MTGASRAHLVLAVLAGERGEGHRMIPLLEEARRRARALGERWIYAGATLNLAYATHAFPTSDGDQSTLAEALLKEALRLHRKLGDQRTLPATLLNLGFSQQRRGDLVQAASLYEEALTVAKQTGNTLDIASALQALSEVARDEGDISRTSSLLRESLAVLRTLDSRELKTREAIGGCFWALAPMAGAAQLPERAARLFSVAYRLLSSTDMQRWETIRAEFEAEVDPLRTALGEASFTAAWEAGQVMTLDDAFAEVDAVRAEIVAASSAERTIQAGHGLSPRELEVLRLMAEGLSNQQIADALFLSFRTITTYVTNILTKLGVESRTGAVAHAIRVGIA